MGFGVFALMFGACADHILTASLGHDSGESEAAPAGVPAIDVDPRKVAFGGVSAGEGAERVVVVRNVGNGTLTLVQPQVDGDAAFTAGKLASTSVTAGKETSFSVTFRPAGGGEVAGTVGVLSTDPEAGLVEVALTGFTLP